MKDMALNWIDTLSDEWLMIYDNLPDKERLQPMLPRRRKGNIIYTSRSKGFVLDLPAECVCEVTPLKEDDAVNLLLKISGNEHVRSDEEEMKSFRSVAAELGYLPLAIEAVGSYIREGECDAMAFLERFRSRHVNSAGMQLFSRLNSDGSSPARPALYTALDLSYDAISAVRRRKGRSMGGIAAESALQILNLLCFYHNERIPVLLIRRGAEQRLQRGGDTVYPFGHYSEDRFMDPTYLLAGNLHDDSWFDTYFQFGVELLQRFSLVKYTGGSWVSMHVMVQAWVQDRMDDKTRRRQALFARIILAESIDPAGDLSDLYYLRTIPSHVNACMAHEAATVTDDEYQAHLDFKLGWYYKEEKQFDKALEHLARAARTWKFVEGANSRVAVSHLSALAVTYHEMGRTGDSEAACREMIDRLYRRRFLAEEDWLSREAEEEKRLQTDAKRQRRALLPRLGIPADKTSGKDQESNKEKAALRTRQRTTKAAKQSSADGVSTSIVQTEAPQEQEETIDEWEAELAWTSAYLANVLYDQGRFAAAKNRLRKAIELLKGAECAVELGIWLMEDDFKLRFEAADIDYWIQRHATFIALPEDVQKSLQRRGDTLLWIMGMATCFYDFEKFEKAYEWYDTYYSIAVDLYGPSGRKTLDVLRRMALCQLQRGLFADAEELAQTAVSRAKGSYGPWHIETTESLYLLSSVRMCQTLDMRPGSEAWCLTQEAYDSARTTFAENHYMAVMAKVRLDRFRNHDPKAPVTASPAAGGDEFSKALDQIFASGYPDTTEEFMAIVKAELQELGRRKLQAKALLLQKRRR